MYVYKSVAESRVTNAYHIIHGALTESRSPAGPRRLGTATRMSASLSRRLSAFFGSTPDQDPRTGKVCRFDTRPGDVCERAERSEGSDSTLCPKRPCFGVQAAVCAVRGWGGVCTRFHPRKRTWAICARGVEARMADALEALI